MRADMIEEANDAISMYPSLAYFDNYNIKRLQQYRAGRLLLFVHPSLYRTLKLTFPLNIRGLSLDGIIRSEMCLGSIGQALGVLTPVMFNAEEQP